MVPLIKSILIATGNAHKVSEIQQILGPAFRCQTLEQHPNAPKVIEDAPDFAGNATKKAVTLANWLARQRLADAADFVLADDSGLEVDALNGAPGVHSARFAALDTGAQGNSRDPDNNAKLLRLLEGVPAEKRTARFRCVIAFTPLPEVGSLSASPVCSATEAELTTQLFEGKCEGVILATPRGGDGFGYDPLFVPNGFTETFAELGDEAKNRISHRSLALAELKAWLKRMSLF